MFRIRLGFVVVLAIVGCSVALIGLLFQNQFSILYYSPKLRSYDQVERALAQNALARTGRAAVPCLSEALQNAFPAARIECARTLARIGHKSAVPALVNALHDPEPLVRCEAAEALGIIGDRSSIPALLESLKDKRGLVRFKTAVALDKMGIDAGIPVFIEFVDHLMLWEISLNSLKRLTNQSFGRDKERWREWWAKEEARRKKI